MKIVVLVKEVPDTFGDRELDLTTFRVVRGSGDAVIDEINDRALELALRYKDSEKDTEVVLMSMAPQGATANIRKRLAAGAGSAVHLVDDAFAGSDALATARALAVAMANEGFDLVIAGNSSTDGGGGVIPSMIAELLEVPSATSISSVSIDSEGVSGVRVEDHEVLGVRTGLPAIISVTEDAPEARFASFKGIMSAKRKPYRLVTAAETGSDPEAARTSVLTIVPRPAREAGTKVIDDGDGARLLAEYLVSERLVLERTVQ